MGWSKSLLLFIAVSCIIYGVNSENIFFELSNVVCKVFHKIQERIEKDAAIIENDVKGFAKIFFGLVEEEFEDTAKVQCYTDFIYFLLGLWKEKTWAITMFDSYGKIGSGLTRGNLIWPGNFKLCYTVHGNLTQKDMINGKYCWAIFDLNLDGTSMAMPGVPVPPLQVGMCVPDSCSSEQISRILRVVTDIKIVKQHMNLSAVNFIPKSHDFWADKSAVTAFSICIVFAIVIIVATIFDLYLKYIALNPSSNLGQKRLKNGYPPPAGGDADRNVAEDNISTSSAFSDNSLVITDYELLMYTQQPSNLGLIGRIILSFSLRRNAYNLFSLKVYEKKLSCLNGIRVLSMIWLVLAQTYIQGSLLVDNLLDVLDVIKEMIFQMVAQSIMAIDTFFLLSGFLVTYNFFKKREENDGKISWVGFYFHRYWRLTPLYVLILFLFDDNLINHYSNGPFWPQDGFEGDNCKKHWWWNMLYINNFTPARNMCMPNSWYLANELQFFIISPLFLIPLVHFVPIAGILAGIFLLSSWITSGILAYRIHLGAAIDLLKLFPNSDSWFTALDFYYKPYIHIGPYIVGIFCGWILINIKCRAQIKRRWLFLGWILSAACCSSLVFGLYKANDFLSPAMQAFYNSLSRTAWACGIAWVIFACATGYGGAINYILSWPAWQPLGRLTYCVYLISLVIINTVFHSMDTAAHFSHQLMLFYSVAIVAVCYLCAACLSLVFEIPFLELEKAITRRK